MYYRGFNIKNEDWTSHRDCSGIGKEIGLVGQHDGTLVIDYQTLTKMKILLDIAKRQLVINANGETGPFQTGVFKNIRYEITPGLDEEGCAVMWVNLCWDRPETYAERMERIAKEKAAIDRKIKLEDTNAEIDKILSGSDFYKFQEHLSKVPTEDLVKELEPRGKTIQD